MRKRAVGHDNPSVTTTHLDFRIPARLTARGDFRALRGRSRVAPGHHLAGAFEFHVQDVVVGEGDSCGHLLHLFVVNPHLLG